MTALEWQDPPPPANGGRPPKYLTETVLQELRAHPGRWARIATNIHKTQATRWRDRHPDLEFRTVTTTRPRGDVYVRWPVTP